MPVAPREQGTGGAARGPSTAQRAPDRGAPGQREDGSQSGSGKKREAGAGKKRGAEEALGKAPPSGQAKAPKKQGDGVAGPTSRGAPGEGAGTRGAVEAPETPRKDVTGEKSAELPDSPGVDRAREEAMEDALEEMEDETGKAMDSLEGALAGVQKTFKRKMREVLRDARREVRTWKRQVKRLKEMRDDLQRRVRELEGEVQRLGGGGASDGGRSV